MKRSLLGGIDRGNLIKPGGVFVTHRFPGRCHNVLEKSHIKIQLFIKLLLTIPGILFRSLENHFVATGLL